VRKCIWKWPLRRLDIDGIWHGTTTYKDVHPGTLQKEIEVEHDIVFEQDCLRLVLKAVEGNDEAANGTRKKGALAGIKSWGSHTVSLGVDVSANQIRYAYWVRYKGQDPAPKSGCPAFPISSNGYEELAIMFDRFGRPSQLTGTFNHCVDGDQPAYSGAVAFRRGKRKAVPTTRVHEPVKLHKEQGKSQKQEPANIQSTPRS
jgi:hypothetical protein